MPSSGLGGFLSRFRRRHADAGHSQSLPDHLAQRALALRFGPGAVGVISNYGDASVEVGLFRYLRSLGVRRIVYSGPVSVLREPRELWKLIEAGDVDWVYGQAERPRLAPEVGLLPAGADHAEINGILFRHFALAGDGRGRVRFGELQWPPPGSGQQESVEATLSGVTNRIVVIGSGLEYERWVPDPLSGRWELTEQNVPGYAETPVVRIQLPTDAQCAIIHPTSRGSCCSVIDIDESLMVLLML